MVGWRVLISEFSFCEVPLSIFSIQFLNLIFKIRPCYVFNETLLRIYVHSQMRFIVFAKEKKL